MPNKVDYRTFSQRVKNKYPEYINMGDLELAQMWVSQNPQYGEFVIFDQQPVKKKDQAAPSLGAQGGLPSQQPSAQPRKAREERFFGGTFGDLLDALDMPTPGVPGSGLGIGDFIDDMGRAFSSGKKAGVNISTSRPLFFSGPGSSDEEVQNFVKAGTEYTGPSDEATQFYKDYEDNGKTTFGFVKALAKNPGVAPELVVQSASQFLFNPEARAAFGASIAAGAGIGALASAPLGGIGAAPGAIAAILPGVAAANTAVSTLSSFSELMKQELDQRGLEFNEDNVRTILEDEKALRKIRAKSAGYGITIGAFDLATAKVGGAIAAKIPMTTRAGKIKSTLATTGAEAVGGSAGEAAARGVTGQELDPAEIGLEGIAEIPGAAPTLLSQVLKRPTYKINGEFVGQADVDDILQNSSRQELENTKFEVFNDVNMYGSKFRNRLEDLGLLEEITEANPNASEADINRLFELNSKLKKVENLNSESAKASADWLRSQIREVQDGLLTQEFAPQEVQQVEEAAPEAPQMAPTEVSPEVGMEIPQEDQGVLQVINSVIQPISSDIEARMNNAEEIPMSEIEAVVDALIDAQQSVQSQEGARTRQTQGGFVTEFGALSEDQKRNFDTLIEQQINKLLNYEFATITTTEQAGEKTKTAGLVATPREGRPLPESVVSRDRFDGAGVRVGGRGAGRITVKRIPGFGGRSVYGVSFGNRKGVSPVEDLEFDNLEFVAPEILADGSFNARVKDSKSGLEFTITDPELSIDLAIAAQLKEAGRKEFPQPAFLEAVREVTQGQPTQVTTFPNLGRTGTTPAAVGVEPQTEQDVRQETNAPQEGRAQGENAAPVPQEEGRQEGQVTPPDVAQEGETPPAAKRTRKTEQQKADEGKAILDKLKETLRSLKAKPGGGANIDLTFGVVPISKAVWNTAIDTAILAIDAGQSIAQAVKAASDYISSKIDGDWGKAKFEQYMDERFSKSSPKPKSVFHAGTLDGKGNIYVSPIREQANEYSSMSGAPVLEFEINENAMAPESEVRDLIRSLGLNLPEGYNLDELFLYEALDTRVKSSLSQGDIDKLYAALKDRGYEGISFRDEDIRGVNREGIDNFIVFDKSSLSEQQAQPEVSERRKGKSAEEIFNSSEIFEGQTPNQAKLFFADALNDFKVPYVLGQPALDPRSDMTLTLNGAKFLLSENQRGPSNYVLIDDFLVNESLLGTGKGRDALVKLIEYADKNGITLVGEPLAMDGRRKSSRKGVGLNQKDLTDFYKRYGFTKISKESLSNVATAETGFFERKPQQQAQPEASERWKAKSAKSAESLAVELKKALNAMKVKVDKGVAREGTFMIPALVYNGAIDAAILAVEAGKTVANAVIVAVKYINEKFDGEWDKGGFTDKMLVDLTKPKTELTISGLKNEVSSLIDRYNDEEKNGGKPILSLHESIYDKFRKEVTQELNNINALSESIGQGDAELLKALAMDMEQVVSGMEPKVSPAIMKQDRPLNIGDVWFDLKRISKRDSESINLDTLKEEAENITIDDLTIDELKKAIPFLEIKSYVVTNRRDRVFDLVRTDTYDLAKKLFRLDLDDLSVLSGILQQDAGKALNEYIGNIKKSIDAIRTDSSPSEIYTYPTEPQQQAQPEAQVEATAKALEEAAPDYTYQYGGNRQKRYSVYAKSGLIWHGGSSKIKSFDVSKIKGGSRGELGYGFYFGSSSKPFDYGAEITFLNSNDLKLIDGEKSSSNAEFLSELERYAESISSIDRKILSLEDALAKSKNTREYNEVLKEIISLQKVAINQKKNSNAIDYAKELLVSIKENPREAIRYLAVRGTENQNKLFSEIMKGMGYDGMQVSDNWQLVVYPNDKIDDLIVDPNRFVAEVYHKAKEDGSNPKLVQAVEDLLGQAAPEAKPEKTIAEQRKEFRETAKKYFDGLKKMGIAFDPEGNSKEDIAFLKALAKYIKLELDAGMVTFKGFMEKTANLIEGFNEKAVVAAAKEAWAKEVVKAYPKLYAKYNAAKRKELEREIKDIRKTMIRRIMDMTEPKIVNFKSQLKTEKRRLSKEAAAQLAAIRNAYDVKTMMAMEPQDLMELLNLTEGIYKEGRSEIKALNESLDEAAQIQGEEMLAAIASKDKRLEKLDSKEAASKMLAKKAGVVVAVKGDDRVIMKEEKDLEALDGEGYTFLFLNTTSDKFVDRSFLDSVVSFFSGKLRTINENARDLRTALELIKSKSKESQDFINGLVAKMNKASVTKARKSEEWSSILKAARTKAFGPDIKFGYTNWMNAIAKVDGKPLRLINGRGVSIGPINNGKIVSLYRQLMDPTNLVKTDDIRKIDLSDESIQSIIDYMNLPANRPGKSFALDLTDFFRKVAKDTKVVLENNGYNSTKLDEKRYNAEDFEGDEFIAQVMGQFADTRTEGFIPYTPIQATESPDTAQGVEIKEDDLFDSGDLQKNFSVISNNMITRRPGGLIVPTDIRQTLNAYPAGMANMNAKLPLLRETQSIFSKRNLTAMSNAFAPQFTENLKANYISFMTDRVTPVISNKTEAAMKTWLMTSTAIPMFLNPKTGLLQLLGSPNFIVSYDLSKYIDASKKLLSDGALFKETILEIINLPIMKQRYGGRFSPDSRVISEEMSRYGKVAINIPFTNLKISAKELLSKGYIFSSIGDVFAIALGGAPIYYDIVQTNKKKYIAEGMSVFEAETKAKQDAEEKLFEIIQETQQSSEAMYLSEFQKQSITRIFSSFATSTMQYYRKARRAAARMKNKEGNQLQNAYEILHYTAINAAVFQFFSSMFVDWLSGPGEDELEEMSREERMDFVRYMEDVMATVAQGTGGLGVALQALILAYKESEKSGKPEKIVESALRTVPAVRMKYDAAINTIREWKRGDYVRSLTKGAELANIPADRIRSLGLQVSDALMENLDAQERIARLMGFRTESWMREKKQGEIWNGVQSAVDKSTPAERQRAISNTKSAYRDLFQLYGKRYAEATTEAEKARVDSIASKELLNVYNHRQGGPEFTEELQKLFNQSAEFNSLPKDMQKLKNMETNRKIGDVVEEVLSLEKKSEQKAMEYWSSLVNNGILSKNEIERVREEYNTRKGLQ